MITDKNNTLNQYIKDKSRDEFFIIETDRFIGFDKENYGSSYIRRTALLEFYREILEKYVTCSFSDLGKKLLTHYINFYNINQQDIFFLIRYRDIKASREGRFVIDRLLHLIDEEEIDLFDEQVEHD